MTTLDAVLLAVLAAFGLRGFFRGFVRETTSLLALVAATAAVVFQGGRVAELLMARGVAEAELALIAAGAATFLAAYLAVTLVGWGVDRLAHALFLGTAVRVLGIAFAIGKGAILLGFALIVGQQWAPTVLSRQRVESSRLARPMVELARALITEGGERLAPQRAPAGAGATG
ncbi:MAG TPA: CvpA family protein [Candidatus Limnocylindria bacterium]|nr:CvpA family protein [Candidatus Limnocylindria bacterium]